jgi:pyridoxal phosphate enzyme (YggS family)
MTTIAENLAGIRTRIQAACARSGRDPIPVRLLGVTKTVSLERIREAVTAGVSLLGENYVQEARHKVAALADLPASWHFIGHLQSNKAKVAVELFDWIHTLDRNSLAQALNREAQKRGHPIPVLLQVNMGGEDSKSGLAPDRVLDFFLTLTALDGLKLRGLMTLPPFFEDPEHARPYFRQLAMLMEQMRQEAPHPEDLTELSMGMSHDFEVAIEEGATLVRIGTALFGERR